MAKNHTAPIRASAPEAAAYEHASPFNPVPAAAPPPDEEFEFASQAEADAYWAGVADGSRQAGRTPGIRHMPRAVDLDLSRDGAAPGLLSTKLVDPLPGSAVDDTPPGNSGTDPARAVRHDGWTAEKKRMFLETLADTGVVADACRASGMSRDAAYAYRRRASGRAFALAWNAALLLARARVSDDVMSRSVHGVIDRVYRNGELVAERHRFDNRLTMAVLSRLDRQAEGLGEGAEVARAVAQEYDRFLDILAEGVEGAEDFIAARFPSPPSAVAGMKQADAPPAPVVAEPPASDGGTHASGTEAALLARLAAYQEYGVGLPIEADFDALDPEEMESWTEEQWRLAEFGGFLEMLGPLEWPDSARIPGSDETNGMCKLRKLYLHYYPEKEVRAPEQQEDEFGGCEVWEDPECEGRWLTNFPPGENFEGFQEGAPGTEDYVRALTGAELEAVERRAAEEEAEEAALLAQTVAAEAAARDRFFARPHAAEKLDMPPLDNAADISTSGAE